MGAYYGYRKIGDVVYKYNANFKTKNDAKIYADSLKLKNRRVRILKSSNGGYNVYETSNDKQIWEK